MKVGRLLLLSLLAVGTLVGAPAAGAAYDDTSCRGIWPGSEFDCGSNGYDALSGTSMATPHVAAVAALVIARYGAAATPDFVYAKLKQTADDLGSPGVDPVYGYGRVNAQRAVTG
jgi:subtilisin family serine protease